jgi:hypothetical protein
MNSIPFIRILEVLHARALGDGAKGTVTGVAHLAAGGDKVATDGRYREQSGIQRSVTPKRREFRRNGRDRSGKAADGIGNTASHHRG